MDRSGILSRPIDGISEDVMNYKHYHVLVAGLYRETLMFLDVVFLVMIRLM